MNAHLIVEKSTGEIFEKNGIWCHDSLGDAKNFIKREIKSINRRREKPDRIKFEDYQVITYEMNQKETHKL